MEIFSEEEIKENIKEIFWSSKNRISFKSTFILWSTFNKIQIKVEFELTTLLDKIYNEFSSLAKERNHFQLDYNESILVEADENLIYSILPNIHSKMR